jgi:hypothetical protein
MGNDHSWARNYHAAPREWAIIPDTKAQPVFSRDTNVHPAFGVTPKIERNVGIVHSVFRQTAGVMLIGDRSNEIMNDPLHRPYQLIRLRYREEASIRGRDRGMIRARAPQQVTWKNAYWRYQRPPFRQPIGPFTQGQLQQQSVLYRVNQFMRGEGK